MKTSFATAIGRWASFGPYYAMFPLEFAAQTINDNSLPGHSVLDPFVGRGSSIYAASISNRASAGIEINPVGWLFSKIKVSPAPEINVLEKLDNIKIIDSTTAMISDRSREFFNNCFSHDVLIFLLSARKELNWRHNNIDATLMAFILIYLHGKSSSSLSNQMRQGKSMSPEYSIRWWRDNKSKPPSINPKEFLRKRIIWRYAKGIPNTARSLVVLGDSTKKLPYLQRLVNEKKLSKFNLLFTSPPYCGITNYHYDQWIRLWMLGSSDHPISSGKYERGRFEGKVAYKKLLLDTFSLCAPIMMRDSIIYVRTDARMFTFASTLEALVKAFPQKQVQVFSRPYKNKTQTSLFGDHEKKPGEIDIKLF